MTTFCVPVTSRSNPRRRRVSLIVARQARRHRSRDPVDDRSVPAHCPSCSPSSAPAATTHRARRSPRSCPRSIGPWPICRVASPPSSTAPRHRLAMRSSPSSSVTRPPRAQATIASSRPPMRRVPSLRRAHFTSRSSSLSRAGRDTRSTTWCARAALAPGDIAVAEGVAQLRADAVAASGDGNIRGPGIGAQLAGVDPAGRGRVRSRRARDARARSTGCDLRPFIEALSSSIRAKERATEDVVGRLPRGRRGRRRARIVAADYRAGSLYHDLALGLLFELPPELDPNVAAGLRRTLRGRALAYLKKAVAEYRRALAEPGHRRGGAVAPRPRRRTCDPRDDVLGEARIYRRRRSRPRWSSRAPHRGARTAY